MDSFDTGRLIYLILLGLMVVGWFFAQSRQSMNKTLQHAAVWGFIFLGAIAAFGLWEDISNTVRPQQTVFEEQGKIIVPRSPDGHYYIAARVNGAPIQFVLDTGATEMVLTRRDAMTAGLTPDRLNFSGRAMTANGEVRTAPVRLATVTLGPVTDENLTAVVNEAEMSHSLLGMTYLQRWGRIEISNGELVLTR
ncbi:TIGR02281 family clan AA aspartic protease [uncultured Roseobacter sp.]|uniref:retropepsin-like aspartic protease family protein n=1 Tax=uncultured Roseobacter sp. TaxID=114847 RepID=UPI00261A983B|nr:TIGR02281 family clan AA aspartic protease [uncultured Roseobacter sp.]